VHGERGYQIVLDHATTPELQQRCLQFVRWGAEMRYSYTKALYETYVAPDLVAA
jgi:pyrroloquinoline-quinone synthase